MQPSTKRPTDESIANGNAAARELAGQLNALPINAKKLRILRSLQADADRRDHRGLVNDLQVCGDASFGNDATDTAYVRRAANSLHDIVSEYPLTHERDWRELHSALQPKNQHTYGTDCGAAMMNPLNCLEPGERAVQKAPCVTMSLADIEKMRGWNVKITDVVEYARPQPDCSAAEFVAKHISTNGTLQTSVRQHLTSLVLNEKFAPAKDPMGVREVRQVGPDLRITYNDGNFSFFSLYPEGA